MVNGRQGKVLFPSYKAIGQDGVNDAYRLNPRLSQLNHSDA